MAVIAKVLIPAKALPIIAAGSIHAAIFNSPSLAIQLQKSSVPILLVQ